MLVYRSKCLLLKYVVRIRFRIRVNVTVRISVKVRASGWLVKLLLTVFWTTTDYLQTIYLELSKYSDTGYCSRLLKQTLTPPIQKAAEWIGLWLFESGIAFRMPHVIHLPTHILPFEMTKHTQRWWIRTQTIFFSVFLSLSIKVHWMAATKTQGQADNGI